MYLDTDYKSLNRFCYSDDLKESDYSLRNVLITMKLGVIWFDKLGDCIDFNNK